MAFPVTVLPPHAAQSVGGATGALWTAKSEPQNLPLARQVTYDPATGIETSRSGWSDQHVIDRIINIGVAWHEGQLFGWVNQLIGLSTAIALLATSVVGVLMWLRRRPAGTVGAPVKVDAPVPRGAIAIMVALGIAATPVRNFLDGNPIDGSPSAGNHAKLAGLNERLI